MRDCLVLLIIFVVIFFVQSMEIGALDAYIEIELRRLESEDGG